MLKVFNILLLVSMASMCRAVATWKISPRHAVEAMALTHEGHLLLAGSESPIGVAVFIYDINGRTVWSHVFSDNTTHFVKAATEVNQNKFIIVEEKIKLKEPGHHMHIQMVTKAGEKVWEKVYGKHFAFSDYYLVRGNNENEYVIAGASATNKEVERNAGIMGINMEGTVVWNTILTNAGEVKGFSKVTGGYLIATYLRHGTILSLTNSTGYVKHSLELAGNELEAMSSTLDENAVFIMRKDGAFHVYKIDSNLTIHWQRTLNIEDLIQVHDLIATSDGHYMIAIHIKEINNRLSNNVLVKLYGNGEIKWKKEFKGDLVLIKVLEAEHNVYFLLLKKKGEHMAMIHKYTVPKYAEGLHCQKYEQCQACGLGFYWNYTSCVPCSVGCVECLDIDHCINCSSRYAKTEDNRCIPVEEPCNCDLPNLTPECREKCALPVCSSNSSLPFTYKTDNKKVCTCPDEMLSNETHCLPKTDVGCHPLCDICAGEYCLQCKNITGIFVSRTHSIAVKCQCDYGYQFNSTACIPVKRIHNVQSSESLVAIALGIIGGLVAVGSVAFIMYLKYRRDEWMHGENLPDIQTGKEQHTVEVSKEMEVHAITRDDERTGEIMFKRE
eukprot:TRINITY_DN165_c0_g1_i8.p1 TRINITY_DN165_c0_g1~~TRINITY_DN165_c0_g1_i8.p1  ORF type:complete len:643 (+),score=51.00 TRINITY_DN165_c0_g1_i8:98-1930(+)